MAVNGSGAWIGFGVGDTDPVNARRTDPNWQAVTLLTDKLWKKFKWVRDSGLINGAQPTYDENVATLVEQLANAYKLPVVRDLGGHAVANLTLRKKLGSYPAPPPPTHAALTVRGTGGIVGLDYTSVIAQFSPVHHEVPMLYAASMGGIPVGAANDPSAPSGNECADELYQMLSDWVRSSTSTFSIFAYSLGTKGVIRFLNELFDEGSALNIHANRLVSVVLIGDPWRPYGCTYFRGADPGGQGIGTPFFTMSPAAIKAMGSRCCWLAHPGDMYTNSPRGATGQILADVEQIILGTSVSDPLGTIVRALPYLMKIVAGSGLDLPGLTVGMLKNVTTFNVAGMIPLILPLLIGMLPGLISGIGGNGADLPPGPAADVQAAVLALKFYGGGISGHINYHVNEVWPGQTYLGLGIQHANDWGARVPVLT